MRLSDSVIRRYGQNDGVGIACLCLVGKLINNVVECGKMW